MLIDMHLHEKTYSSDSILDLREMIHRARRMGLDGICITDHESMGLTEKARDMSREMLFPVFVGAEVLTHQGDLLVFGVDHVPHRLMGAEELVDWVARQGGATISAHPYRQNGRGMGDSLLSLDRLSGVEGLNGSTPFHLNRKAQQAAESRSLPIFGGSDAHHIQQVGKYATSFSGVIRDIKDLVEGIKEGNVDPVQYKDGFYQRIGMEKPMEIAV